MRILDDVSFTLEKGETFGLVGESGSGKSMTAMALLGLVPAPGIISGGSVRLEGEDLLALPESEFAKRRGRDVAMIFQDPSAAFSAVHTIGEQISMPLRIHSGLSQLAARNRGIELLDRVGVIDAAKRFDDYPHQFSGGMAQRAMIAMALSCEPKVLLADEPTTALDVTVQAQVLDLLMELQDDFDMGILLVTHDLGVVAETCNRVGVMYAGQIFETGDVEQVFAASSHPYTRALMMATPSGEDKQERLTAITGRVPPPWAWPEGCRFHPRCEFAEATCQEQDIDLINGSRCRLRDELDRIPPS
jgi:peptide/nickel transport system permease protein